MRKALKSTANMLCSNVFNTTNIHTAIRYLQNKLLILFNLFSLGVNYL